MRDPRELLALLTAKIQRFQVAPGGIPFLTPQDMAQALAYIGKYNPNAAIFTRFKYLREYFRAEDIALRMRRKIGVDLVCGDWKVPRKEFILDLCYLALCESVDPHTCPWCLGREKTLVDQEMAEAAQRDIKPGQTVLKEGQLIVCSLCHGTGKRTIKQSDRSRLMGVTESAWSHSWADKYRDIQVHTVDRWEGVIDALRPRLA